MSEKLTRVKQVQPNYDRGGAVSELLEKQRNIITSVGNNSTSNILDYFKTRNKQEVHNILKMILDENLKVDNASEEFKVLLDRFNELSKKTSHKVALNVNNNLLLIFKEKEQWEHVWKVFLYEYLKESYTESLKIHADLQTINYEISKNMEAFKKSIQSAKSSCSKNSVEDPLILKFISVCEMSLLNRENLLTSVKGASNSISKEIQLYKSDFENLEKDILSRSMEYSASIIEAPFLETKDLKALFSYINFVFVVLLGPILLGVFFYYLLSTFLDIVDYRENTVIIGWSAIGVFLILGIGKIIGSTIGNLITDTFNPNEKQKKLLNILSMSHTHILISSAIFILMVLATNMSGYFVLSPIFWLGLVFIFGFYLVVSRFSNININDQLWQVDTIVSTANKIKN